MEPVRLSLYLTVEKLKLVISAKLEESGDPKANRGTSSRKWEEN